MKDSQDIYDDVVHKLNVHFTPKKNLSYERYSFIIYKQRPDDDCSAYITRLKKMGETCEYENLNTEVKDQFIMSCKSTKMREKLLLEQEFCRNKKIKIMDDGNKKSVSSNRKPPKDFGK